MVFAGVGIGAATAKDVILRGSKILGYFTIPTDHNVERAAEKVTLEALEDTR